ncbi:unnamed protein product [Leptidea sinapis]|uniref:Epoxide hydrolase n=1 Tax=Leptidea sinapis TaxID=189913 RepID=A0A5E4QA45_9NEOP|nr:unnamed protein product [Leptidea sinapis]
MQENLRRKFEMYRRSTRLKSLEESAEYGINSDALGQLFAHWQFQYKYPKRVKYLNKFDHFKTTIQGLDIHFVHVKPTAENVKVIPLLLLHGWPSSIKDFYEAIPLLTSPRPGYDFVFEVVVPSLPGFCYSQGPVKVGFSPHQIAIVMRNLMERIGFKQFYVQGGDFGHTIGSHMAILFPDQVLGFHTSFPVNFSKISMLTWLVGGVWPSLMPKEITDSMYPLKDKFKYLWEEFGYMHIQATKPDTGGIALQDSPVGLAAYIVDRILVFTNQSNKLLEDGGLSSFNKTDLIDNVMLYWSTGSITTSLRLYKESFASEVDRILEEIPTSVPTWGLRTKHEIFHTPDFILRRKYNLVGITNLDTGGHFVAFEKPVEFTDDVFTAVKKFRLIK